MNEQPFPLTPSLWAATAAPAPQTTPLRGTARADVAIIGAGYAGLSTALHLARHGIRATVVDAREIGFGGSGRNGGQVIPGLKYDPDQLEKMFGPERGARLAAFGGRTADTVFDLIARYDMAVPHRRSGWIQGAHTEAALDIARQRAAQWSRRGAPVRELSREQVAELIGTSTYLGGWVDERAGALQPLSYVRGLARAAMQEGAAVFTESPASRLERHGSGWTVHGVDGSYALEADRVVVCTNGYSGAVVAAEHLGGRPLDGPTEGHGTRTGESHAAARALARTDLVEGLRTTIIDANTYQVATLPLPESIRRTIFPEGHVSSDTRNLLFYFRLDHTGRLLMGGRGPFREPRSTADWRHLERIIAKMFPQAAGVGFDYRWCGRVAVTRDYLPHLHEPQPGLLIDIGCQGRGVGLQTQMGQAMADYLAHGDPQSLPVPITPISPLPLYGLRRLYVNALVGWYRLRDGGM